MIARVLSREVFVPSPAAGTAVLASSYYTQPWGGDLMSMHSLVSRSDTVDIAYLRYSSDNGRTWSETIEWPTKFDDPGGVGRRHGRGGYVDPHTGRYLTVWTQGVLPTDNPLEGMTRWTLHYAVSDDGGTTQRVSEQIIHQGDEYDAVHHLPGVTVGKNCVMMGDLGERPLTRSDGVILLPVQSSPVGPDGMYANPGAGLTYTDCLLLLGRWQADGRLAWTTSQRVIGDPARTTRGLIEPTLAELADGRILMVMRGSNDAVSALPGYRWAAFSDDGGEHWLDAQPWTCTDGMAFFSPSSTSQLIPYAGDRLLWMGNICTCNPRGNSPRYPIVLAEVDRGSGLLLRDSIRVIDDRRDGDSEHLTLSNFYVREDRETGELLLHLTRLFAAESGNWTADALVYRIAVE